MAYAAWANARLLTEAEWNGQPEFIKAAVILLNPSNFIRSQVRDAAVFWQRLGMDEQQLCALSRLSAVDRRAG